jgi:eukaryotic-like serine/threonine-protein kinase
MKIYAIISLIAITAFASCKKTISNDAPLTPIYQPAILVPTSNNILYSLNAATGEKNWEFHNDNATLQTTPVLDNNGIAYFGSDAEIIAIDAKTGILKWRKNYNAGNFGGDILFYNDRLYFGSTSADSFFCTDLNGTIIWRKSIEQGQAAPVIAKGCIYITGSAGSSSNKIWCLDITNGSEIHTLGFPGVPDTVYENPYSIGQISYGSPTYKNNRLLVSASGTKTVMSLNDSLRRKGNANSNCQIWKYTAGDQIFSAPAFYGDMIVVGSHDFNIHCIDANAGASSIRWKYKTAERISSSACFDVVNENVIMGSNDFNLYAINFVNGQLRWKAPTSSIINSTALVYKNKVYCSSLDKNVYCLNAEDGSVIWKYNTNATISNFKNYAPSPVITEYNGTNIYPSTTGNDPY